MKDFVRAAKLDTSNRYSIEQCHDEAILREKNEKLRTSAMLIDIR